MPTSPYERVLKVPFKRSHAGKNDHRQADSFHREAEKSDQRHAVRSYGNLKRPILVASLPSKTLKSGAKGLKEIVRNNATLRVRFHSSNSTLKSRDLVLNRISLQASSILGKSVQSSNIIAGDLLKPPNAGRPLLSLKMSTERVKKHREIIQQFGRRALDNDKGHLSHAQTLQLLRGLMEEPLCFLELRGRFGVSKQTVKRLVRNGLLNETWGSRAVGVKFVLSDKGKAYLKGLEAAAKYKPNAQKNALIRLKQTARL